MMKKNFLVACLSFIILCCLWELTSQYFIQYQFVLPSLSSIVVQMWQSSDLLIMNSKVTLREMAGGFLLALIMAFPLAWIMYLYKSARTVLQPFFVGLQSIPMFTLAPIMIVWFGWSDMSIILPTALMIFFPLTLNIYQGLMSTPQDLLDYFHINQATRWQTFSKLQLPYSLPHIFAGFRIAAAGAGIGAIAGEWAGAQSGLGVLMLKSRRATELEITFGALLCLIMVSLWLYSVIAYTEYRYKKHQTLKGWVIGLLLTFIGIIGAFPSSMQTVLPKKQVLRLLLDWFPNSNHVPIYAGVQRKIFAKHGIQLQIIELNDPSDSVPYITSGKADLALYYLPDLIQAQQKGADVKLAGVLVGQPLNSFIFRQGEGISSPKDLSGKIIGYSLGGNNLKVLQRLLHANNLLPKKLINVNFDLVTLLANRQVDVIYGAFWNIEGEHLKALNIKNSYFQVTQLGHPVYSELIFISRHDFNRLEAFKLAMQESIDYCKAYPEEAFELYAHCHPEKSAATFRWEKQAWLNTVPTLAESQQISRQEWAYLKRWMEEL
ncbi:putative thiamine biosynthesis protein [Neochlamydia sp. EPS4]|nr:putative thiamine biosynthesis protein [Neochlamydia sp. EPS4]